MGFGTTIDTIASTSIDNAALLLADFKGYIAVFVGVMILGVMVAWFTGR